MSTTRREFLVRSAAAGSAIGLGVLPKIELAAESRSHAVRERAAKPLNILIIGGTGFTGPEQVEYAISRGHKITLFNRDRTRPGMFKGRVNQLIGDLNTDTSALKGKKFDVVIDNPTTFPAWVRNVGQYMKDNTSHYIFISTISVYAKEATPNADETADLNPMPADLDPYTLEPTNRGRYYGALKARSELEVRQTYADRFTIIRPGLIVGPLDVSDRFTYWPVRIDRGGEVLSPGNPTDPVQIIDSRDIAEWTIRMAEAGPKEAGGIYNATGPKRPLGIAEMLYGIKAVTTSDAWFTWVPADFLQKQQIRGWRHMPTWVPPEPDRQGFSTRNIDRALAKGLTFRPLAVTAKETLEWAKKRPKADQDKLAAGAVAGISAEREAEVLAAWHAQSKA
jgi:2'-hydroxyisoflavone reductase